MSASPACSFGGYLLLLCFLVVIRFFWSCLACLSLSPVRCVILEEDVGAGAGPEEREDLEPHLRT